MVSSISILIAVLAIILSGVAYFYLSKGKIGAAENYDELMNIKKELNEMNEKYALLSNDFMKLKASIVRMNETSISSDLQTQLNNAINEYNQISEQQEVNERARKLAAEKVLAACNEVCRRYVEGELTEDTFNGVYRGKLNTIIDSDDLKSIFNRHKSRYQCIDQILMSKSNRIIKAGDLMDKTPVKPSMTDMMGDMNNSIDSQPN